MRTNLFQVWKICASLILHHWKLQIKYSTIIRSIPLELIEEPVTEDASYDHPTPEASIQCHLLYENYAYPIFDTVYFHGLCSTNRYKAIFLGSLYIKKQLS